MRDQIYTSSNQPTVTSLYQTTLRKPYPETHISVGLRRVVLDSIYISIPICALAHFASSLTVNRAAVSQLFSEEPLCDFSASYTETVSIHALTLNKLIRTFLYNSLFVSEKDIIFPKRPSIDETYQPRNLQKNPLQISILTPI